MIGRQRGCYARIDDPLGRWGNVSPTGITTTSFTVGSGINDTGQIIGYYEDSGGTVHGFLDKLGQLYDPR
jgi:probable HAF family extracellular repeat protein